MVEVKGHSIFFDGNLLGTNTETAIKMMYDTPTLYAAMADKFDSKYFPNAIKPYVPPTFKLELNP